MAGPDLQKEVRAIKKITNTGSSRNFAAVTVQHIKAPPAITVGVRTGFLLLCLQLPCCLIGRGAPPATSCRGAVKEACHSTAASGEREGKMKDVS